MEGSKNYPLPSEPRSVSLTLPKQWVLLTASMRERKMEGEVAGHCSSEDGGGAEELTSLSSESPSY